MEAVNSRLARDLLGFVAIGLGLASLVYWHVEVGEPYCQSPADSPACPLEYDAPQRTSIGWLAATIALSVFAMAAAAYFHWRARATLVVDSFRWPSGTLADRWLYASLLGSGLTYALLRATNDAAPKWMLHAQIGLGSAFCLCAIVSLFVRPTSGIAQRWLGVLALAGASYVTLVAWAMWALSTMG